MKALNINIIITIAAILISLGVTVFAPTTKTKIIAFGIGVTIIFWVWLISYANHFNSPQNNAPKQTSNKKINKDLTLLYLFENDFNNLLRSGQGAEFVNSKGEKIQFKTKEYFNFEAQSKFIGFYIPSSPSTFDLLKDLPKVYQRFSSKDKVMVEGGGIGFKPVNNTELIFSGRVFIYHEYPLLEAEKRELYALYEKDDLSPQFRGPDYLFKKKETEEKIH
ncbi:hypothetical protein ACFL6N_06105 [Thermodesulfobacteriota bacterium]